jgi:dolichol-phosphate mannosyltransferase
VAPASVVLPTYNEAGNLERLVRAVLEHDVRVLVVDDNSPDGTGAIADRLADELDAVEVLHRPRKAGLGRAYLAGFDHALRSGAELVIEMDADFSHDPADLPLLVAAAEDADLVLGSRYVEGGGVVDWGLLRRALSRGGSFYARTVLGVPVRDLTGGFKCFRREVLEAIAPTGVQANGYAFQIELTYRAIRAGFRVTEVPIVFRDRAVGRSKMTPAIALEAVWRVPALRLRGEAILFEATGDQPSD